MRFKDCKVGQHVLWTNRHGGQFTAKITTLRETIVLIRLNTRHNDRAGGTYYSVGSEVRVWPRQLKLIPPKQRVWLKDKDIFKKSHEYMKINQLAKKYVESLNVGGHRRDDPRKIIYVMGHTVNELLVEAYKVGYKAAKKEK